MVQSTYEERLYFIPLAPPFWFPQPGYYLQPRRGEQIR